jgi:hypothetical protein
MSEQLSKQILYDVTPPIESPKSGKELFDELENLITEYSTLIAQGSFEDYKAMLNLRGRIGKLIKCLIDQNVFPTLSKELTKVTKSLQDRGQQFYDKLTCFETANTDKRDLNSLLLKFGNPK